MISNKKQLGIVFGPASSGKGTLAERLARAFDYETISSGNLIREWVHDHNQKKYLKLINNGHLLDDIELSQILFEKFNDINHRNKLNKNIILDGIPRRPSQIKIVKNICETFNYHVSWIIVLEVPIEVILERVEGRVLAPDGKVYNFKYNPPPAHFSSQELKKRKDDRPDVVIKRYQDYHNDTISCIKDEYFHGVKIAFIDATKSIAEVFEESSKILEIKTI